MKKLSKKYPHVIGDIFTLIQQLEQAETPGDQIPGVGYEVYKVRVKSSDLSKDKSGGFQAVYYVRISTHIILITVYVKNERVDISPEEIRRLIEEHNQA